MVIRELAAQLTDAKRRHREEVAELEAHWPLHTENCSHCAADTLAAASSPMEQLHDPEGTMTSSPARVTPSGDHFAPRG